LIRVLAFLEATYVSGPAKNVLDFARQAAGFEEASRVCTEIAAFQTSRGEDELTRAVASAGLRLHGIEQRSLPNPSTVREVRQVIAASKPDIIQTHSIKSHFLVRISGAWKQCPWVAFHHGYTRTVLRLRAYNHFDRWSLRQAARVVTVSRAFAGELRRMGIAEDRITVLHNAISPDWGTRAADPHLRAATRSRMGIGVEESVVLMVGRLSREKRHDLFLQAIHRMRHTKIRAVIAGEGPERTAISQIIASLGIEGRVTLAGHQTDVTPCYAAADLVVISSDTEGSPNALLEAMAAGKPVVATAVGGIPEIVTHEDTALLVSPGNPGKLADAIALVVSSPDQARSMAERARALIVSHHSPQQRARFLAGLYASILSGAHP
jgi:glycosyltransferase involved in cell wall biosynthesis